MTERPTCQSSAQKTNIILKRNHIDLWTKLHKEECLYGVTITFAPKKRFPSISLEKRQVSPQLRDLNCSGQFIYSANYLKKKFIDFKYILYEEYTKAGNIHYHGVIWHPEFKVQNSRVEATIRNKLRQCAPGNYGRNALGVVNNLDKWSSYSQKETGYFIANCDGLIDPLEEAQIQYLRDRIVEQGPNTKVIQQRSILDYW